MLFIKSPLLSAPCEPAAPRAISPRGWTSQKFLSAAICFLTSGWYLTAPETFPLANTDYKLGEGRGPWRTAGHKELLRQDFSSMAED